MRGSAFFYENILGFHADSIRETGVFANSFGDARPAWISGTDVADLCATALLDPQSHANTPIVYPPGHELLSQQEIADIISEETGREVRYQHITADEWSRQLQAHSGGVPNHAMIEHITTHGSDVRERHHDPAQGHRPLRPGSGQRPPPADLPKLRPATPLQHSEPSPPRYEPHHSHVMELLA